MGHNDLPEVVDAADIYQGSLNKSAHGKRVDLLENLALSRLSCIGRCLLGGRGEHGRVEVLEDADCELGECADELS